ncbi:MAG: WD40 repeat domain-containing protein [Chitinophagales bacterium]
MQKYLKSSTILLLLLVFSTSLFAQEKKLLLSKAKTFFGHEKAVEYIDFSPSGDRIASAGHDNLINIWSVFTDEAVKTLTGHTALVNHVTFSKNGKLLASASDDGTVKIWDLSTGIAIKTILNAPAYALFKEAFFVVFSPDEQHVYFGGKNKKISRASIYSDAKTEILYTSNFNITSGLFSPDGKNMIFSTANKVVVFNLESKTVIQKMEDSKDFINDLVLSTANNLLAAWSENGNLLTWTYPSLQLSKQIAAGAKGYSHIDFSNDGHFLISGNANNKFNIWDSESFKLISYVKEHKDRVRALKFGPNGQFLASGSYDGQVMLWEINKKETPIEKELEPLTEIQGRNIESRLTLDLSSPDVTVKVWDNSKIDGDIVTLYLNGETILEQHSLIKAKENVNFTVEDNSTNVLILFADDLGKAPPATVALLITDGINTKTLTLRSDLEQSEAITLKYYPQE